VVVEKSPKARLDGFLAKYSPEVAAVGRAALKRMRQRLPGSFELVYDNYNALVIGFSPTERPSDAVFSIALYPRWVNLFFLDSGASLPDPHGLLKGSGKIVRGLRLESAADLDKPAVRSLIAEALARAETPMGRTGRSRLVIRAVSTRKRPRRPR
jgi:hypothetical protein